MDIRELSYFMQVARDKSFTKAAKSLFLSQPALSKTIKKLEDELGVQLLEKHGRQMVLTDCGTILAERIQPILSEFENLGQLLQDSMMLQTGSVNIGITPMIATLYLAPIITDFCNRYPGIELKLFEDGTYIIAQQVLSGELDMGICMSCKQISESPKLEQHILFEDEIVALFHESNPLSRQQRLRFEQLKEEKFNIYNAGYALKDEIFLRCSQAGFTPSINLSSSKAHFLVKMVGCANGICLLPRPYAQQFNMPELRMVPFDPPVVWSGSIIIRKERYLSFATTTLLEHVKQGFSEAQANE